MQPNNNNKKQLRFSKWILRTFQAHFIHLMFYYEIKQRQQQKREKQNKTKPGRSVFLTVRLSVKSPPHGARVQSSQVKVEVEVRVKVEVAGRVIAAQTDPKKATTTKATTTSLPQI